jgi:methylthioribose-1-phosphate isomerase
MLDQRRLPVEEVTLELRSVEEVARAIEDMAVRGAPAIGCAAALGVALAAVLSPARDLSALRSHLDDAAHRLERTRPTAVNLFWGLERMRARAALDHANADAARLALVEEARAILEEDIESCRRIGWHGRDLVSNGDRILTHCNAGALATAGYGTALGVVRGAVEAGKKVRVFADETRPFLQGARLTAWELQQDGIPVTLITDSTAGALMHRGEVDLIVVGADRIAANGDVANKIGTYTLAVLARENDVPFYVAAPLSTVDFSTPSGKEIPIEERSGREVEEFAGLRVAPRGVDARYLAFDLTPASYITAIVTDRGIARQPYEESLARLRGTPPG